MTEDEAIDRVDRGLPPTTPEEAKAMRPWQRLHALLRELPEVPADVPPMPPGWEERAVARWQRRRRRIVLAVVVIALVWAAAAIALLA